MITADTNVAEVRDAMKAQIIDAVKNRQIIELPPLTLTASKFNPVIRTEREKMEEIRESMTMNGFFWWQPILATMKLEIGDGHRRWMIARELNLPVVPVITIPNITASEIWSIVNGGAMNVTSKQVLEAHVKGIEVIPEKHRKLIEDMINIGGEEMMVAVQVAGFSPVLITFSRAVAKYCGLKGNLEFIEKTVYWLIKYKATRMVRNIMDAHADAGKLIRAIESDQPITLGITVG